MVRVDLHLRYVNKNVPGYAASFLFENSMMWLWRAMRTWWPLIKGGSARIYSKQKVTQI
jgi:hypothetical protein